MNDLTKSSGVGSRPSSSPRSVVVTGGLGFIGHHLVSALLGAGIAVTVIDNRPFSVPSSAGQGKALSAGKLKVVLADISKDRLDLQFGDVGAVIHLAGVPGVRDSWGSGFRAYSRVNIVGTQRVIEACIKGGVGHVVMASSSSVYGECGEVPLHEGARLRPVSPYGVTKSAAEALCEAYAKLNGEYPRIVMLRYFTVYGPHQRADMLIARVIDAALRSKHVTINGDGSARRDFTYVSDAVRATFLALSPVEMANPVEAVNVGSGTCSSVRDVIGLVEAVAGRNIDVKYRRPGSGDVSRTLADVTKARRMLGYYPTVSLRTGVIHQFDAAAALLR